MTAVKKNSQKNKILLLLILILAISFFVRIYNLEAENLWSDETVTVYYANKSVFDNIKWSPTIGYFPLYHIIMSSWVKIFGISEFSVRFLSVIFGTLSVYLVFLIGTFMFNKKIGIYSAVIAALSPFNVYYSQEARVYTLFLLLALTSIYFYLKYIESAKNRHMVYYVIFTLLMLNLHSPSIFVLIFQNLHYFLFIRRNIKKWIFIQLALFFLFTPLLFIAISNFANYLSNNLIVPKPNLVTLMRTFYIFSAGLTYKLEPMIFGSVISIIFALLVFFVILREAKNIKNRIYSKLNKIAFLLLWLSTPVLLLILQAYIYYSIYFERYLIVSSIALYMLVALSISRLKYRFQLITIASIIALSLIILYFDFETQNNEEWKEVADYIKLNKHKEDAVIIHVQTAIYSFAYYYDPECFKSSELPKFYEKIDCMSAQNIYGVRNADELPKEVIGKEKVFLILWNEKYIDAKGTLLKYFSANYKLTEEKLYKHVKIYTFINQK